jgi:hypothetical protein
MTAFDIPSHLRIRPWRDGAFVNLFLLAGRKAGEDNRRVSVRACSDSFFGLERDSARPSKLLRIQTREVYGVSARTG